MKRKVFFNRIVVHRASETNTAISPDFTHTMWILCADSDGYKHGSSETKCMVCVFSIRCIGKQRKVTSKQKREKEKDVQRERGERREREHTRACCVHQNRAPWHLSTTPTRELKTGRRKCSCSRTNVLLVSSKNLLLRPLLLLNLYRLLQADNKPKVAARKSLFC